ncbi:serine/threonine-protein kinase [Pontiella sulfatireligans]|uniref:Serine/threonine-protein kinase PknB n=1 Tax=Pontiella sulfatireligans TaxID=2750658 RepID=A0A6C2UIR9_9BACT|nr:serine/threonine-protein kinase [Pontiella sulfatireligans]VGO19773.1 Serine/threonine-protein kinase PknB [Pontiella sulfatireligans]
MDPNKQSIDRMREIFTEARSISTGNAREEFLNEACGEDGSLREEVESLLKAYITTEGFLSRDAVGETLVDCPDLVGITIGHYHLEELLGEGGFGEVYRAQQTAPLRREVALKIVKLGMDTKEVLGRFEVERQALARMDHPNIAQVYDAGVAETGRPYFVMELVRGVPFLEYCDRHRLPLSERIQLFRQVCDGVQHAHQKGILHRDLKPSNILVCEENGKPLPKVIDFGVAKSLEGRLTDQTLVTMKERVMGTPMYMSPEQLGHDIADIDTRTDIYSLGIILYELVAGTTPLQSELPNGISEIRRLLETIDLPRPSKLFHAMGAQASAIAHGRKLRPQTLYNLLRGDLDWVVMKAIEKERDRRYGDVGALSHDLERYLNHEPVSAGPPSMAYRTKKFIRRHRVGLVASACVSITLIAGAWISTLALMRAVREAERASLQESRAMSASERAQQQELLAGQASDRARRQTSLAEASQQNATLQSERAMHEEERATLEADRAQRKQALAEAAFGFLTDELLLRADPAEEPDRDIKLRTVVDQAAERLEHHLSGQPLEKARIHQMLGSLYLRLAEYDKARKHADESVRLILDTLDPDDPKTLACLHDQAEVMFRQSEYKEAEAQFRRVLENRRRVLGSDHPDTLLTLRSLTVNLYAQGRHEEAEEKFRTILEMQRQVLGPEDPETLQTLNNLALVLSGRGVYAKAEEIHRTVLESQQRILGAEHPATLKTQRGLTQALRGQGKDAEAEAVQRTMLEVQQRVLGPDHPDTLDSMHNLARALCAQGKRNEAEPLFRKLVEIRQQQTGAEHPQTLEHMRELACVLGRQGQYGETEEINRTVHSAWKKIRGTEHPETLDAQHALAHVLFEQEKYEEAEKLARSELNIRKQMLEFDHPDTLEAMELLASILRDRGRYKLGEQYYRRLISLRAKTAGAEHPKTLEAQHQLALTLHNQTAYPQAEQLLRQILETQRRVFGESDPQTLKTMGALASVLRAQNRYAEAEQFDRQILELHGQKVEPRMNTDEHE